MSEKSEKQTIIWHGLDTDNVFKQIASTADGLTQSIASQRQQKFAPNAILVVIQLGFTYISPMQLLFAAAGMSVAAWVRVILVASSVLFLVEIKKYLLRTYRKPGAVS